MRFFMHVVALRQGFPNQHCLISAQYSSLFYEFYERCQRYDGICRHNADNAHTDKHSGTIPVILARH